METDYFKVNTGRQFNPLQMQGGSCGPLWVYKFDAMHFYIFFLVHI